MSEGWCSPEQVEWYLSLADGFPHRVEGEAVLVEQIAPDVGRVLDLGTGDGRLMAIIKAARPAVEMVGLDMSPPMLERVRARFAGDGAVTVIEHNLELSLPELGLFDAVVSSFAIHHLEDDRKRQLYGEIAAALKPGAVFCNLEHVSSPTVALHERFRVAMGIADEQEDPNNRCLDVETQLRWLRELGYTDVDCTWKWTELALISGTRP